MIAAIYARKSTDQTGVADDTKSVTRRVESTTAYAIMNCGTVATHGCRRRVPSPTSG